MNDKGFPKGASDVIMKLHAHIQTLENEVYFLREELKENSFLLSLITVKQNASNFHITNNTRKIYIIESN